MNANLQALDLEALQLRQVLGNTLPAAKAYTDAAIADAELGSGSGVPSIIDGGTF